MTADLVISGATVIDGMGSTPFDGWIAVSGDRIVDVGRPDQPAPEASREIAAGGAAIAPGFIDVHNHSDLSPMILPEMPSTLRQGVTTVVVGNCGFSPFPLSSWDEALWFAFADADAYPRPTWAGWADYLDAVDAARPAVNIATLVGHGSVRREVLGDEQRPPDASELDLMVGITRDAVADGAFGMSTGLIYVPGIYSRTDEIVSLARGAAAAGGLYASHIRGEGRDLFDAVGEALRVGDEAGLPVHVSHLKCESSYVWGRTDDLLGMLRDAPDATGDQYPYEAWNSYLSTFLPPWAPVGEVREIAERDRDRLRDAVEHGEPDFQSSVDGVGWDRIVLETAPEERWRGRDVAAIAADLGMEPFDAVVELLGRQPDISCIGHAMTAADVRAILADPEVFVASDAWATSPDGPGGDLPVHPRGYGTFPRALALAREERLLPIEAMVRKMTSLPAERFGLHDRGWIDQGAVADLVVFDPTTVRDAATYEEPHAFPDGIETVIVNGTVAWTAGDATIDRAGKALRRR